MRKIVSVIAVSTVLGCVAAAAAGIWRRNPRIGAAFVNSVVNPGLLRRGLSGGRASEIGTLEHVGRRSGVRRLTPVHPEPTRDGFRVLVPLGVQSQWAGNVIAAGRCRLQLHDQVFELDEPAMVPASEAEGVPWAVRRVMAALGFRYLNLRTFASSPGTLDVAEALQADDSPRRSGRRSSREDRAAESSRTVAGAPVRASEAVAS